MASLNVLSWNVYRGLGAPNSFLHHLKMELTHFVKGVDQHSLEGITSVIKKMEPHVVALQELSILTQDGFNSVKHIASVTNLDHVYYDAERTVLGQKTDGNVVFSKLPLHGTVTYPLGSDVERRTCALATVRVGKKKVLLMTTHLGAFGFNWRGRRRQFAKLAHIVLDSKIPIVMMGDLNCGPHMKEFKEFIAQTGLVQLVQKPTFSSYSPRNIFDHILVSPSIKAKTIRVLPDKHSDHLAVYAELEV